MHETETFERVRQERLAADIRSGMTENPIAHETDSLLNPSAGGAGSNSAAFGGANYGTDSEFVRLQDGRMFYHEIAIEKPVQTSARWQEILHAFRFYRFHLLGTALAWFLLDVDFYANGLFNHEVTGIILSKTDAGKRSMLLFVLVLCGCVWGVCDVGMLCALFCLCSAERVALSVASIAYCSLALHPACALFTSRLLIRESCTFLLALVPFPVPPLLRRLSYLFFATF